MLYDVYILARGDFDNEVGDGAYMPVDTTRDIGAALVQANRALMQGDAIQIVPREEVS